MSEFDPKPPTYTAVGGFVVKHEWIGMNPSICTIPEAARAWEHMQRGPAICKDRGHDYSVKVPRTSNMYLCFRCEEPGWEVPVVEPDRITCFECGSACDE